MVLARGFASLPLFRAAAADSCHPEHREGSRCGAGSA